MNLQKLWKLEEKELSRKLFRRVRFKGGGSSTTVSTPPPPLDIEDLKVGRDPEAEEAFFGLFSEAEKTFLEKTEPERGEFRKTIDQLNPALANISAALQGEIPTSQTGIGKVALNESLQQESNVLRSIEDQLAAGNAGASFFGQRLKADARTKFGQSRARIIPDLINNIIATQEGLAGKAGQARLQNLGFRTGIISDAANFSQSFQAPSRVKTQNISEVARQSKGGTVQTSSSGGKGGGIGQAAGNIGAALIGGGK